MAWLRGPRPGLHARRIVRAVSIGGGASPLSLPFGTKRSCRPPRPMSAYGAVADSMRRSLLVCSRPTAEVTGERYSLNVDYETCQQDQLVLAFCRATSACGVCCTRATIPYPRSASRERAA